ncbi:Site-specific DNA recombinase [Collimonas sp. OK307]|uniref:recombinase family protein n=1 Tax=Collimonas sp. OK307 TaxID=1801620 RepID=UPI0008F42201|nr:recombinase family protein [Collimonas sp. OK307]SFH85544.1 Site-specific DNA recombinase [Collimonas sp. OK307]
MAAAYSYIRFSSVEQKKGDSFRRQREQSSLWADARGIMLDESLDISDLGTSAYRGKNSTDGGLSAFIAAIDDGRVAKGSFLLVENLDRLSRQPPLAALHLLQSIVERGVTVVTLVDKCEYTGESLQNDPSSLLISIITMFRAHQESKVKGDRVRSAWKRKKQKDAREGKPITRMAPSWLRIVNGAFEIIEEKAEVVRRIFDLATNDGLGQRAIVTVLKKELVCPIGRIATWSETSVRRILQSQAVIGVYQPRSLDLERPKIRIDDGEPIDDYYPSIIPRPQFYDAQRLRKESLIPKGPRGTSLATILTGIVFCGACGATMRRKGASTNDVHHRLRCSGSCGASSWKYEPLELVILGVLSANILPHMQLNNSDKKILQEQLSEAEANLKSMGERSARLIDALENGLDLSVVHKRLREVEDTRASAAADVKRLQEEIKIVEMRQFSGLNNSNPHDGIVELLQGIDVDDGKIKEKIRYALSRSVDRIVLLDSKVHRTVRMEVGTEARHIDINRNEMTYSFREDASVSGQLVLKHPISKNLIVMIP